MDRKQISIEILVLIAVIAIFVVPKQDVFHSASLIVSDVIEIFSSMTARQLTLIGVLFAVVITALNADKIAGALEDQKIANTVGILLHWIQDNDDNEKKEFQNEFTKNGKNVCFGGLFDDSLRPISFYLAFSDESSASNRLGKRFSSNSNETAYIYCQYSDAELREKVPLAILDPDLKPVEPDQLDARQKTYQSCSERKIIARLFDDYSAKLLSDCSEQLHLVLLTKFQPCEFCQPFIININEQYKDKLNIEVLHIDFLQLIVDHEKELISMKKEYEKPVGLIRKLLCLLPKQKPKTEKTAQNTSSSKSEQIKFQKTLESISYKQCKKLAENGVSAELIKEIIKCMKLPDDETEKIFRQVVWHECKKM